ncbi:Secreted protein [Pararobbsia alpina]
MLIRRSIRLALTLSAACLASACAIAAIAAPLDGEYVYTPAGHASGTLSISGGKFTISTVGSNCHSCDVQGKLDGNHGIAGDADQTCRITFSDDHGTLKLDSGNSDACRSFCGARAMFDGQYQKAPQACSDHSRSSRLKQARGQYGAKNFTAAATSYQSLLDQCSTFMDWIEADRVRSELALTQYHMGDNAQCLSTLAPTRAIENQSNGGDDSDGTFGLPPCDAENYQSTGKAILHNAALCKGTAQQVAK